MSDDPQSSSTSVTDLFADYLTAKERGADVDFEELCRKHPQQAAELRRLHGDWEIVRTTLEAEPEHDPGTEVLARIEQREKPRDRYQLRGEIARGGQGAILRVWDDDLRRNLAMKVMLGAGATDATGKTPRVPSRTLGRFLEEAQVTGQLDHPGIVPVHELGLDNSGQVYFTMKLVKGQDLRTILQFDLVRKEDEGWSLTRALNVLLKVCESVAYAHSKGVIHRDLKPSNVMVGKFGEVYVMDWGLARVLDQRDGKDIRIRPKATTERLQTERTDSADSPLITMDGDVVGTPAYMSPEQASGKLEEIGRQTDVYSIGAMLYHLLTSRMPYLLPGTMQHNYAVWHQVQKGPPEPVHKLAPDAPAELVAICERAMARERKKRYASVRELAEDLRAYLEDRVVSAYRTGVLIEFEKWVVRNRGMATALAGGILLAIGSAATIAWMENENAKSERDVAEATADFLAELFEPPDPSVALGQVLTAEDMLDRGATQIRTEIREPAVQSRLLHTIGDAYVSLGLYDRAEPLLVEAYGRSAAEHGADHEDTLGILEDLVDLYARQGKWHEAEPLARELVENTPETLDAYEARRRLLQDALAGTGQ